MTRPLRNLQKYGLKAYKQIPGIFNLIDRLNIAGYEVLYLSDNVEERVNYLEERFHFLGKFRDGIFSHKC